MNDYVVCPRCQETNAAGDSFVGVLGTREHHRCRYCGGLFSFNDFEAAERLAYGRLRREQEAAADAAWIEALDKAAQAAISARADISKVSSCA